MRRTRTAVIADEPKRQSLWTALVLLFSLVAAFGLLSLVLVHNHGLTDRLLTKLPSPTGVTLAADAGLAAQLRTEEPQARLTRLSDQTPALVVASTVINESPFTVSNVVMEAEVMRGSKTWIATRAQCGKVVSDTLLNRLPRDELNALMEIQVPATKVVKPGERLPCQVTVPGIDGEATEVRLRIASAEPLPGHPRPRFDPWE